LAFLITTLLIALSLVYWPLLDDFVSKLLELLKSLQSGLLYSMMIELLEKVELLLELYSKMHVDCSNVILLSIDT